IDRSLSFLLERIAHVRHARATAAQINSRRRLALLLRSIMAGRSHDLRMQTRRRAPDNFRHSRDIRVGRIGKGTSETDETIFFLPAFGSSERFVELLRQRRRDRTAPERNTARKNFARLDEE